MPTPTLAEQVRELARQGCGDEEIVSVMTAAGFDANSVRRVLPARNGTGVVHPALTQSRWSAAEAEKLCELYGTGLTAREIAEKLGTGRSPKAVNDRMRYLRRMGATRERVYAKSLPLTPRQLQKELEEVAEISRRERLFAAVRVGATRAEIAAALPNEDAGWIDARLVEMRKPQKGCPPLIKVRKGKYSASEGEARLSTTGPVGRLT